MLDEPTAGVLANRDGRTVLTRIIEVARTGIPILMSNRTPVRRSRLRDKRICFLVQGRTPLPVQAKSFLEDHEQVRKSFLGG